MDTRLTYSEVAEQNRFEDLRVELDLLESEIANRESQLAKIEEEIRTFESRYLHCLGRKYDELSEIERQIAEVQGLDFDETAEVMSWADDEVGCGQNRLHSDKLKKLYREVARKFHPDLTSCENERRHRHQLMVEVNRAYESGAEDRLQDFLEAGGRFQTDSDNRVMSAEMILLVRKFSEANQKLLLLDADIEQIMSSEIYKLKQRVENAESMGIDLLAELVSQVDRQIRKSLNRLEHLRMDQAV